MSENVELRDPRIAEEGDEFWAQLIETAKEAVRSEMRLQLKRNPSADKRRVLELALGFQQQKYEKRTKELEADGKEALADDIRTISKIALEEWGTSFAPVSSDWLATRIRALAGSPVN